MFTCTSRNRTILVPVGGRYKTGGEQTKYWPNVESTLKEVDLGEQTSCLDHVYLGCTQRGCETSKDMVDNYRILFESRIFAGAKEKLPCSGKTDASIFSWSYDMEGHAKKCVERSCGLANKTLQQLYKVATPCLDDHQSKEEELGSVWECVKSMLSNCTESAGATQKLPGREKSHAKTVAWWHGRSCEKVLEEIGELAKKKRLSSCTKSLLHAWTTKTSKRKNLTRLENYQQFALRSSWNAYIWPVLVDLAFYGPWTNLRDRSQNGPKPVTNDYLVWSLTFITHVNTNSIVMWGNTAKKNAGWHSNVLENCQKFAHRLSWNACTWHELDDLTHRRMMVKQETISGPFQGTTFTVITESNCTCREKNPSQCHHDTLTWTEQQVRPWMWCSNAA